jgi:hypothetical protein
MAGSGSTELINVRSASYWIASVAGRCGHCRAAVRLVALALPRNHQSLTVDCDLEKICSSSWETMEWSALLFYVEYLPEAIRRRLQALSNGYRLAFSERTQGSYWSNHCAACGALLEDHDLFCEPGGPFLPMTASSAAAISLERIDEALEAGAAGYACDPNFLGSMVEG